MLLNISLMSLSGVPSLNILNFKQNPRAFFRAMFDELLYKYVFCFCQTNGESRSLQTRRKEGKNIYKYPCSQNVVACVQTNLFDYINLVGGTVKLTFAAPPFVAQEGGPGF